MAALGLALLAGCGGSGSDDAEAGNPLLITASDLGDSVEVGSVREADTAAATLCGPDSEVIREGSDEDDFAAFDRDQQRIVVGVWEYPGTDADVWLDDIRDRTAGPTCRNGSANEPPTVRWRVTALPGQPETAAFAWTRWAADDADGAAVPATPTAGPGIEASSGARAYRLVGHHVVMAAISNDTATPPTADELEAVLDRQSERVETSGASTE